MFFKRSPSRWFLLTRDFGRDVALFNALNQRRLGLRAVPVAAITGTVGRTDLCSPARLAAFLRTSRFQGIVFAMARGDGLPPVDLYLLDGHYYIRDGHHRVAAARELGILDLDARVIECLPLTGAPAAAWHRARATIERITGLTGLHVRRPGGYALLQAQIAEHAWYLGERGQAPCSLADAAARWEREIYRPVVADLDRRGVLDRMADLTAAEWGAPSASCVLPGWVENLVDDASISPNPDLYEETTDASLVLLQQHILRRQPLHLCRSLLARS